TAGSRWRLCERTKDTFLPNQGQDEAWVELSGSGGRKDCLPIGSRISICCRRRLRCVAVRPFSKQRALLAVSHIYQTVGCKPSIVRVNASRDRQVRCKCFVTN